ncbi:MAG: hypothetical protein WBW80_01165 [Acidimicrobiales bacterium]
MTDEKLKFRTVMVSGALTSSTGVGGKVSEGGLKKSGSTFPVVIGTRISMLGIPLSKTASCPSRGVTPSPNGWYTTVI